MLGLGFGRDFLDFFRLGMRDWDGGEGGTRAGGAFRNSKEERERERVCKAYPI